VYSSQRSIGGGVHCYGYASANSDSDCYKHRSPADVHPHRAAFTDTRAYSNGGTTSDND